MIKKRKHNKKGGGTIVMGLGFCLFLFTLTAIITDMGMVLLAKNNVKLASDASVIGGTSWGKKGTRTTYYEYNVRPDGSPIEATRHVISVHEAVRIETDKAKGMAEGIFAKNVKDTTNGVQKDKGFTKDAKIDSENVKNSDDETGGTFSLNASTKSHSFFSGLSDVLSGKDSRIHVSTKSEVKK